MLDKTLILLQDKENCYMDPRIKERITRLKQHGYEIRLPGGKSRDGSFACFGAIVRASLHKGKIRHEVLVIPYRTVSKTVNNDTKEKMFTEEPEQTLEREIQEETGILINKGEYFLMNALVVKDNRIGRENEIHTKYGYFIYQYDASNFRTRNSPYQRNIGAPFWTALNHSLEFNIAVVHLWIIKDALRFAHSTPVLKASRYKTPQKKK